MGEDGVDQFYVIMGKEGQPPCNSSRQIDQRLPVPPIWVSFLEAGKEKEE